VEWIIKKSLKKFIHSSSYQALLCGGLPTSLLIVSSALYWPTFVHPPHSLRVKGHVHI